MLIDDILYSQSSFITDNPEPLKLYPALGADNRGMPLSKTLLVLSQPTTRLFQDPKTYLKSSPSSGLRLLATPGPRKRDTIRLIELDKMYSIKIGIVERSFSLDLSPLLTIFT